MRRRRASKLTKSLVCGKTAITCVSAMNPQIKCAKWSSVRSWHEQQPGLTRKNGPNECSDEEQSLREKLNHVLMHQSQASLVCSVATNTQQEGRNRREYATLRSIAPHSHLGVQRLVVAFHGIEARRHHKPLAHPSCRVAPPCWPRQEMKLVEATHSKLRKQREHTAKKIATMASTKGVKY